MWKTFFIRLHHSMKIFSHFNRKSMNFLSFLCFPLLIARQRNRNWWQRLKWNWFSIEIRWMFETTLIAWSKNAFEFATFSYQPVQSQSPLVFQRFSTHDRKIRAFPTRLEQNRLLPMNEVAILRAIVAAGRQSNCLPRLYTKHFLVSGVKEGIRSVWLADVEENIFFRQAFIENIRKSAWKLFSTDFKVAHLSTRGAAKQPTFFYVFLWATAEIFSRISRFSIHGIAFFSGGQKDPRFTRSSRSYGY